MIAAEGQLFIWKKSDQINSSRPKAAYSPKKQDFAASAEDPMKLTKTKGSKLASQARFCCLRLEHDETRQGCLCSRVISKL